MREKGGFGPCGRAEREPFGHTSRLSRSRGALSPVGAVERSEGGAERLDAVPLWRLSPGFESG